MSTAVETSRSLARTALVVSVAVSMMFVLFSTDPSSTGFAQSASPSGSPSSTPTGYEINFLNPSRFSEEISMRNEQHGGTTDPMPPPPTTYHLVAWVNQLPPDPHVEFKYRVQGEGAEKLIAEATPVGPGDTFEFEWEVPDEIAEGQDTFSLYAVLLSGDQEVARDTEEDLHMNRETDEEEEEGTTAEFVYPVNGGPMGFFERQDRPTQGMVDVIRSGPAAEGNTQGYSDATVVAYYTVSRPGSEPVWTFCGEISNFGGEIGVRCSLAASHELEQVTAMAAEPVDYVCDILICFPVRVNEGSGDAHRVLVYEQVPTTLTLTPDIQNERPVTTTTGTPPRTVPGACSATITARLTDQEDRRIPNAPIDVHAVGPSDELRFDDSGNNSSAMQNPQDHKQEETENCEGNPPTTSRNEPAGCGDAGACSHVASFQGEHDDPGGNDMKHVESSLGGGTSDAGTFVFQLWSAVRGETAITVWVDNQMEDDTLCSEELSTGASIGWAVPAPAPSPHGPTVSPCPAEATPSPQATRTPSTSPSGTPTEDPRGCTIVGTDESEALEGTPGADVICAGDGDDLIRGLAGNDTIYADAGNDEIRGGNGNDFGDGGEGKDTIRLGGGNDVGQGGRHNDVLTGGGGLDRLLGNGGVDTIRGGALPDALVGGAGNDVIRGGGARDSLKGNRGGDILHGDRGRDRCRGGPGRDRLRSCES